MEKRKKIVLLNLLPKQSTFVQFTPYHVGGMGFRDIKQLNIAKLEKQGWRLMTNPGSLCPRVLEGRYFLNQDFISASRKKGSSHTGRAVLAGRKVLEMGLIQRIGDDSSRNVWTDRWIPDGIGSKPICAEAGASATLVSDLISVQILTYGMKQL